MFLDGLSDVVYSSLAKNLAHCRIKQCGSSALKAYLEPWWSVGLRPLQPSKLSKSERWNLSYDLFAWVAYHSHDVVFSKFLKLYEYTEEGRVIVDMLQRLRGPVAPRDWSLSTQQKAAFNDYMAGHNVCTLGPPGVGKVLHRTKTD